MVAHSSSSNASTSASLGSAAMDLANPVTHSALDFFEKPSVLINYESSFDKEFYPISGASGPTLEFVVGGDSRTCIDLNYIQLCVQVAIYAPDGKEKVQPGDASAVVFTNNTLHSLFSQCEVQANGVLVAESNNTYHHRSFIETELTTNKDSKETWAICQGYKYDGEHGKTKSKWFIERLEKTLHENYTVDLYGSLYVDFFTCEKLLLPQVTLRIKLYRSSNEFSLVTTGDDVDKLFMAKIEKASLFVRKVTLTDSVKTSIERALLKAPARYPYIETLAKSFIIPANQKSFVREAVFGTEPIRRLTLCLASHNNFCGNRSENPFHYQKFGLCRVEITRGNGIAIAGTPLDLTNNVRAFHNTLSALGFQNGGNGITLEEFENHFVLVFDLTSSQEASKNLTLFPELTGAAISLELTFSASLTEAVEVYLLGERFSQIFIDSDRNVSKNHTIAHG